MFMGFHVGKYTSPMDPLVFLLVVELIFLFFLGGRLLGDACVKQRNIDYSI